MPHFHNKAAGMRGVNLKDGSTIWVEPGEAVEIADKDVSDAHEDIVIADKPPKASAAKGDDAA